MAQIFKESSNVMAKLSLMLGATAPIILLYAGSTITRSPANTKAGVALNQPVPFSHKHHVFELGIDCRYCHVAVEKSAVASVPTTETCMSCHSQIWTNSPLLEPVRKSYEDGTPLVWNKVNKVPEFVYFNHSIHIERGISCNQCHGAVQEMTMTSKAQAFSMDWCLTCHTEPEKYLLKPEQMLAHPHEPMKPDRSKFHSAKEFDAAMEEYPKEVAKYQAAVETYKKDIQMSPRQQVFELYHMYQRGDRLTPRGYDLTKGLTHSLSSDDLKEGRELVKKYKVENEQLRDCYICHR
ncbi:MAG: cytochrome c3 family protein [Fimbriimonadaceae bacterium]|nr:cytochrome c3 family protein [Fimbriimonadaceae bacterium]